MALNLLNSFILTLKRVFRTVAQYLHLRKTSAETQVKIPEKERQRFKETRRKAEEERKRLEDETQQKAKEEEQRKAGERRRKAEEERKRLEDETQQKAKEEERRKAGERRRKAEEERKRLEDETQQKAKEEERRKAGERRRKAEEERKRAEEESQQKKEEVYGRERRSPDERGGRSRGSTKQSEIKQSTEPKVRSLKPEIVCWNEGWNWVIGIEVPEELEPLSVAQNKEQLEQDNTDESRYRLKNVEGAVKVTWTEGQIDILLAGAGRNCLIFKMRKNWKELGRLVRCPTTGHYLIIVPQEWKRDEEVSGLAPVAPKNVHLDGYKAHFFYQEQSGNTVTSFITANGERVRVESGSPRFQLVGKEISDASEDMGPLFGGQPPLIRTLDEKGWSDVGVIVLGEEGSGRNRWRTQFIPQGDAREQKLPEEIADRRGGWYFVRIYDNNDNPLESMLLESMDFRFMTAFEDIRMESSGSLLHPSGYKNVTAKFLHEAGCKIELMGEDKQHDLEIHRESGQTSVTVPPKPDCDKTHWILRDGDAEIEVTVLVERIWWAFGVAGVAATDWVDKPITLSRKDFTAVTDKALWVRLPRLRFVRRINVGFDRTKSSSFQVEVEKKEIAIPLRDFSDAGEIENRQEESMIRMWVQPEGTKPDEAVIAKVLADQPTPIQKQWSGRGRKKTAVAYAVLRQGAGEFIVNDQPVWTYFRGAPRKAKRFLRWLLELEKVKSLVEKMDIDVKVVGSQPKTNRQIKAVTHAIARALVCYDPRLKRLLKEKGFGGARVTAFSALGKRFVGR